MQTEKKTFKIKHNVTGHYVCNIDFDDIHNREKTGAGKSLMNHLAVGTSEYNIAKRSRNFCQYFREEVSEEDKKKILVISDILEPITFYFDKPYLKCSKTHKFFCSTELKMECGGGSFPFLSYSKKCAVEFPKFESGFIYYTKSLVYPGRGLPDYMLTPKNLKNHCNRNYTGGGHILVNYKISENISLMSVYHTTNYKPRFGLTKEFITENNKEILITPEDHSHKALKMPLEQAIKATWDAYAHCIQFRGDVVGRELATAACEKRRQQGQL